MSNCKDYSVESTWNGGDTIFKQSSNAAGRTRLGTTSSLVDYLNNNNVVVSDIEAGVSAGELLIKYTDGSEKTVTIPLV
jgi:hypothetical protein